MSATQIVGQLAGKGFVDAVQPGATPEVIGAEYKAFRGVLNGAEAQRAFDLFVVANAPQISSALGLAAKINAEEQAARRDAIRQAAFQVVFKNHGSAMSSSFRPRDEFLTRIFGQGLARAAKEGGYGIDQVFALELDKDGRGVIDITLQRRDPEHRGLGIGAMQVLAAATVTFDADGTVHAAQLKAV